MSAQAEFPTSLARRRFLLGAGAFVVVAPSLVEGSSAWAQGSPTTAAMGGPDPVELDSWLAIDRNGRVTAFFGKPDIGQGVDIAVAQIVAEELDVAVDHVDVLCGDTALTCNQGGVSGSTGVQAGAHQLRLAAAEARRVLLDRAASELSAPVDQLRVASGVISVAGKRRQTTYAKLLGGGRFQSKLDWNGKLGNALVARGKAEPKKPDKYVLVGSSVPRRDVAGKVFGTFQYISDFRAPGMLHGRVIRPAVANATPVSVDEASIASISGARVVRRGDFIGVVANTEWDVVRAARALKVTWSDAKPPFVEQQDLYDHLRQAVPVAAQIEKKVGDFERALSDTSLKVIQAEYAWPFQSHASLAPACAVADVRPDKITLWHSSQKPHGTGETVARLLNRPLETVRSIAMAGPGSYGRNDATDAAADAAILSHAVGRPVRLQGTRADATAWDPKGPASIHKVRAALTADGRIVAYEFMSKGFSRAGVAFIEKDACDTLAGELLGHARPAVHMFGTPEEAYDIANRRMGWEVVAPMLDRASPLRTSHLRDPLGPQLHFASEVFMDECAAALDMDPVAFRLRNVQAPRHRAVIEAVAASAKWTPGPPGSRRGQSEAGATGRGFSYTQRGDTIVAVVADVAVEVSSGQVRPIAFYVAHDCGLVVNPAGLKRCIEGNVMQATSRALSEEVKFDSRSVTSTDWATYRILDIRDAPEKIDIVLLNRPELPSSGAGEPSTRPVAAALCNAIFEATGKRLRQAPFTPERVRSA